MEPSMMPPRSNGCSTLIRDHHDRLTWAVLKAHTRNRAGRVTLRSADPRDPEMQKRRGKAGWKFPCATRARTKSILSA